MLAFKAVELVSGNGMAKISKMRSDLMFSAGFGFSFNQIIIFKSLQYFIAGDGFPFVPGLGLLGQENFLFPSVAWRAAQQRSYFARLILQMACHQANVFFFNLSFFKLSLKEFQGFVIFRY